MDTQKETYKEEAYELLAVLETCLLELEQTPESKELIGEIFRALHTIKGSGAMVGFNEIAGFAHELETVFDQVRGGKIPVTKELINLSLIVRDQIRQMLDDGDETETPEQKDLRLQIIAALRSMLSNTDEETSEFQSSDSEESEFDDPDLKPKYITYRIRFYPAVDIFKNGTNPIILLDELRLLGDCIIIPQTDKVPQLKHLHTEASYMYWDILLTTSKGINAIKDVFIFVEDRSEIRIDMIDDEGIMDDESDYKRLGEILIERKDIKCEELKSILKGQKRLGEILVEKNVIDPGKIESALAEQQKIRQIRKERQEALLSSSIRVPADKLDVLVNLVGELVTAQARLSQLTMFHNENKILSDVISSEEEFHLIEDIEQESLFQGESELGSVSEEIERITRELRDITMSIRMLPIGTTFNKFRRLTRDLSAELGKEVTMTTDGGETELDKTVIERLNDPLVHLIRNAIDHGIETPEIRKASGKPKEGTISLTAEHSGASVLIHISDDGKGFDKDLIRSKAVEKGLISYDAELIEKEIYSLIFAPGFSTAKKITEISGRGVGMDVVKRSIDSLRGSIEISSKKHVRTTITLKLPLTLAIIDGLLVKVGEGYFVVPLSYVEECMELKQEAAKIARERNMIRFRDKAISYLSLREQFDVKGERPDIVQTVIVFTSDNNLTGFEVDAVIGKYQTVIKTLGNIYKDIKEVSGATILGDGTVALILDVNQLIKSAEEVGSEK